MKDDTENIKVEIIAESQNIKSGIDTLEQSGPAEKIGEKEKVDDNCAVMTFYDLLLQYSQRSTCHGVNYLFQQDASYDRRSLWQMICLVCCIVYLYFCITAVNRYLSYPTSSTVEQRFVDALNLPYMTLCNRNQIRKSFLDSHIENGTLPDFRSRNQYIRQQVRLGNVALNLTAENGTLSDFDIEKLDRKLLQLLQFEWKNKVEMINWETLIKYGVVL